MDEIYPSLLWGILLGSVWSLLLPFMLSLQKSRIVRWWCRSPKGTDHRRFERRMRWALAPSKYNTYSPILLSFANPLVLLSFSPIAAWVSMLSAGLMAGVTYFPYSRQVLRELRVAIAELAVQKVIRISETAFVEEVLTIAAEGDIAELRLPVTKGLAFVLTDRGNHALDKLCASRDMEVSVAACEAQATRIAVKKMQAVQTLEKLPTLIQRHKETGTATEGGSELAERTLTSLELQIDKLIFSQLALRRAFPNLYCSRCHSRADLHTYSDWRWVQCKSCGQPDALVPGVVEVIGVVGDDESWRQTSKGMLYINLWDESQKRPLQGEIDRLEVVAGADMDYDWALSAVLEQQHIMREDQCWGLQVTLIGDIPLENNTLQVMEQVIGAFGRQKLDLTSPL